VTTRRALIGTLAGALLAAPLVAEAQQAGKVYRIGYLTGGSPPTPETAPILDAFLRGLRDLGWIEGQNIVIEYRFGEGRAEWYAPMARELAALNVDVIVAVATPAAQAARQATSTIPIVMLAVGDPVGTGLIASLARPGGNVTGIATQDIPELNAKRLELLKQAVPGLSRAGLLVNATLPHAALITKDFLSAAQALHVQARPVEVRSADDFRSAFEALSRDRSEGLVVHSDPLVFTNRRQVIELAAANRLPVMYGNRIEAQGGGLISYGVDIADLFRRGAAFVNKILKGAKPADLPVEQPTKFELVINLKTAKVLGLTIPPSLLGRADEVIP
jgi:putative ABC transport system substrate-binding protein